MSIYQNSSVNTAQLILGNCKIETAASAGGSYVNLGAGMVNSFTHTPEKYDTQAGNAPDPIEGVATEEAIVELELIEFDTSVMAAISCGLITNVTATAQNTISAGGNQEITPRAFRLTNTRTVSGATKETIITLFKCTLDSGPIINFKSDNDTDPIAIIPITIRAKLDSTLTTGSQLYTITRDN